MKKNIFTYICVDEAKEKDEKPKKTKCLFGTAYLRGISAYLIV